MTNLPTILFFSFLGFLRVESEDMSLSSPHLESLSCGHLYYRTLYLDEKSETIYIGAMDRLLKANMVNISLTDCRRDSLILESNNVDHCISRGKSEDYECRNHIRVIEPIDEERLYICGTNAHSPKDEIIYANLTRLGRHEYYPGIGDGIAKCPFDPEDNSTALWVTSGNPGGHSAIYSGTNAEFTKADTVIFRGDIYDSSTARREFTFKRTIKYDSHMLDKPDFVGSYDIGDYVYFFFREIAVEVMNVGKVVYSRIARVCKSDTGGKNILHQNWSTYLKARLNCSLPGDFPFFFNEIQDVYKSPEDDYTFHAVFSTMNNALRVSAICSFRLSDVEEAFSGKYKEQETSTSVWLPVPSSSVPKPRPGTCVKDTRSLPDAVLNFIRKHPLMDSDVPPIGPPIFYIRDEVFTKVVVDSLEAGRYGQERQYFIYYAGTASGKLYKVSRWKDGLGNYHSRLLDILTIFQNDEPVRAMVLATRKRKALFISSDASIRQINLALCSARYDNCVSCIRDPYCGWDREAGKCRPYHLGLLQDPSESQHGLCEASTPRNKIHANFGQSLHFPCSSSFVSSSESESPIWFHYESPYGKRIKILPDNDKFHLTKENGLIILGVSDKDNGRYDCSFHGLETLSSYQLSVDSHRCMAPNKTADYQKIYSDWCTEFQKYKTALKTWEAKQSDCRRSPPPVLEASSHQISYSNQSPYV